MIACSPLRSPWASARLFRQSGIPSRLAADRHPHVGESTRIRPGRFLDRLRAIWYIRHLTRQMTPPIERIRDILAPTYTVDRELGRGGMATVYLAQDTKHERT